MVKYIVDILLQYLKSGVDSTNKLKLYRSWSKIKGIKTSETDKFLKCKSENLNIIQQMWFKILIYKDSSE